MNMHISNEIKQVHKLAPPTYVLLLSKNFDPSQFLKCCSLFVHVHLLLLPMMHLHIFVPTSPPLSSISIEGVLLIDTKDCIGVDG